MHADLLQRLGTKAALSHQTAAAVHGIEVVTSLDYVTATVPRQRSRVTAPGLVIYRRDLASDEVEERDGVRVTTPVRTVLDLARALPLPEGVVAGDSALRLGIVRLSALRRAVLKVPPGRGSTRLRRTLALLDPAAGSVLESYLRVLFASAGLPAPETQFCIYDQAGTFVARVDFCWPELGIVVEADGFAFHSDRAAYRSDRERGNALEMLGWRVLRFTWEDVMGRPDHVVSVVRRVMAAAAA